MIRREASSLGTMFQPHVGKALRLPSMPPRRTAVVHLKDQGTIVGWNSSVSAGRMALLPSPVAPFWGDVSSVHLTHGYAFGDAAETISMSSRTPLPQKLNLWESGAYAGSLALALPTVIDPNGQGYPSAPLIAVDSTLGNDRPFVYVPPGGYVCFILQNNTSFATAAPTGILHYEQWLGPGQTKNVPTTTAAPGTAKSSWGVTFQVSANEGGWIRPGYFTTTQDQEVDFMGYLWIYVSTGLIAYTEGTATDPASITVSANAAGSSFYLPLVWAQAADSTLAHFKDARLTANGVRIRNDTKTMNKEGAVRPGLYMTSSINSSSPGLILPWSVQTSDYQNLHASYKGDLSLAADWSMVLPPVTDPTQYYDHVLEFVIVPPNGTSFGTIPSFMPAVRLEALTSFVSAFIFDPDGGTSLSYKLDYHIEFAANTPIFDLAVCTTPLAAYQKAVVDGLTRPFYRSGRKDEMLTTSMLPSSRRARTQPKTKAKPKSRAQTLPPFGFVPKSSAMKALERAERALLVATKKANAASKKGTKSNKKK